MPPAGFYLRLGQYPKMVEDVKIIVGESPRNDDGEVRLFVDEVKRKLEEEGHTKLPAIT